MLNKIILGAPLWLWVIGFIVIYMLLNKKDTEKFTQNNKTKVYRCETCDKNYKDKTGIWYHNNKYHNTNPPKIANQGKKSILKCINTLILTFRFIEKSKISI